MKTVYLQQAGREAQELTVESNDGSCKVLVAGDSHDLAITMAGHGHGILRIGNRVVPFAAAAVDNKIHIWMDGRVHQFKQIDPRKRTGMSGGTVMTVGDVTAPMPGTVLKVSVAVGDVVQPQQQVVLLESMKMEMTLSAPAEARVTAVNCKEGELVQMGAVLVSLEAVEHESA